MTNAVLDSSALLALFLDEPGSAQANRYLPGALMSSVNAAEVVGKLIQRAVPKRDIKSAILDSGIDIQPFTFDDALIWGELHVKTRHRGLSLADCACLALGLRSGVTVVTADRAWLDLDLGVTVESIR